MDLERVEPRSREFITTFFTDEEQRFIFDGPAEQQNLRSNLVWSAKEAVLKALGLGLAVDTFEVSCLPGEDRPDPASWPVTPVDDGWRTFVATCNPVVAEGRETIHGLWRLFPGFVGTLARTTKGGESRTVRPRPSTSDREPG